MSHAGPNIYIKMKKIKNCQNILEEQPGDDKQNNDLLVQRQTNKPMGQNKSPETDPQKQTFHLQQRWYCRKVEEKDSPSGQLDNHKEKKPHKILKG